MRAGRGPVASSRHRDRRRAALGADVGAGPGRDHAVDVILQMTVRDRNRIALAADALGAAALGVRGFLALWGDPVAVGENPDAAEVRDLETAELIGLLADREGKLPGGREMEGQPPSYLVGSAASAGPAQLVAKLDAGADLVDQIVLDGEGFAEWFRALGGRRRLGRPSLPGSPFPRSGEWIARMEKMGARASATWRRPNAARAPRPSPT